MKQREIKKRLKKYAAACEGILPEKKEERIQALLQLEPKQRTRGTLWDFVWEQIGYLARYCLIWQALWAVVFWYLMRYGVTDLWGMEDGNGVLVMVSLLPPILVLLTVEEITKVYHRSMLEIEYAAKYSLRGAVMTRMSVLCIFHFLIIMGCILLLQARLDSGICRLLVYGFTPMIIMTGMLLKLMQHCQGDALRNAVIGIYVLAVLFAAVGNTRYFGWYRPVYFKVWCGACFGGILFEILQFVRLNKRLERVEQII